MRLDVTLGIEQGRFSEPLDEFVIDFHLAILRAGVSARLAGGDVDVTARSAEYQLRILGMSVEEARRVRREVEWKVDARGLRSAAATGAPSDSAASYVTGSRRLRTPELFAVRPNARS